MGQKLDNLDASQPVMGTEKIHIHFYFDDIILLSVSLVGMAIKHWWTHCLIIIRKEHYELYEN